MNGWEADDVDGESNTARLCWQCGADSMVLRNPRNLPRDGVFVYCYECGVTYTVRQLLV